MKKMLFPFGNCRFRVGCMLNTKITIRTSQIANYQIDLIVLSIISQKYHFLPVFRNRKFSTHNIERNPRQGNLKLFNYESVRRKKKKNELVFEIIQEQAYESEQLLSSFNESPTKQK